MPKARTYEVRYTSREGSVFSSVVQGRSERIARRNFEDDLVFMFGRGVFWTLPNTRYLGWSEKFHVRGSEVMVNDDPEVDDLIPPDPKVVTYDRFLDKREEKKRKQRAKAREVNRQQMDVDQILKELGILT